MPAPAGDSASAPPLLEVRNLSVSFPMSRGLFGPKRVLQAVRGISFTVGRGRTLGLVGESGSGKTTAAMAAIRLVTPSDGQVLLEGRDLMALDERAMRAERRHLAVIFQDPYSSLNPRNRVGAIVREPLDLMGIGSPGERESRVRELFRLVGLRPDQMALFPHQFSGGQRQRIAIARALATNPALIVCDEPVSALDVAIQAQILNLLRRLQDDLGLSYLFISHDLGVVQHVCHEVAVMYLGQVVEQADRRRLFTAPAHPYTRALLESAPALDRRKSAGYRRKAAVEGDPPSPLAIPAGCAFAGRCPQAQARCRTEEPEQTVRDGHLVRCHFPLG